MILKIKREQRGLGSFSYSINDNMGNNFGNAGFIKNDNVPININICINHIVTQILVPTFFEKYQTENGINKRKAADILIDNMNIVLYECGKKGNNFLNGIYFWSIKYKDVEYTIYEIGFGYKGIYFCVWANDELQAVISSRMKMKHFETEYDVYAYDNISTDILALLTVFWDITRFFPGTSSTEYFTLNTWQKELKNKYDKNFISKIRIMDEIKI